MIQQASAIILAAGESRRFGQNKMWLDFGDGPVWKLAYNVFRNHPGISECILVVPAGDESDFLELAPDADAIVAGGSSRTESSVQGLRAVKQSEHVLIHDGARPFVSAQLIDRVLSTLEHADAVCPAISPVDTIKQISKDGAVNTLDRSILRAVQTPQGGLRSDFLRAFEHAGGIDFTDDMALLEALGVHTTFVDGEDTNFKLTTPADLNKIPMEYRTGLGYDIHSFSTDPDRPLWLGGVEFPNDKPGLEGHSDADALLHAVVDSLLGAASLGDIGVHYPPTDPQWKNVSSLIFLQETGMILKEKGWSIVNIDSTVLAERPKVMARRQEICEAIARALDISPDRVSVKATTNEKLGAIGREEGIAAFATATLRRRQLTGE
jgi:2-C-methyl-D-erythritol 4-phosphate cytidylyltransferase/2-C-methyl-D-erythritol 2,4-cyclodiphosphate synthase